MLCTTLARRVDPAPLSCHNFALKMYMIPRLRIFFMYFSYQCQSLKSERVSPSGGRKITSIIECKTDHRSPSQSVCFPPQKLIYSVQILCRGLGSNKVLRLRTYNYDKLQTLNGVDRCVKDLALRST